MAISETKMQMVIANYFKDECDVNTSIKQAFEKGFRIGVKKGASTNRPQGWIPCSERLPENSTVVLVQVDDMYYTTDTNNGILTGWRNGNHWYTFTIRGCETIRYPLAWMPLPKPWKGADDDR